MPGTGRQDGPLRPDWGPQWAELTCDTCAATWVGPIGEPCGYCDAAEERQRAWQAAMVLDVELPDRDAGHYANAVRGWGARLRRAIDAELIAETDARRAWQRKVDHE